jgi:2'-phosphotransferase
MSKSNSNITAQSKFMSWVLRHGMDEVGLSPDAEGYVKLDDFLKIADPTYKLDKTTCLSIVKYCSKQRFGIKQVNTEYFIRANQGHSQKIGKQIDSNKLLVKITKPVSGVFHGTYKKHMESIKATGLNRMDRQHIHMAKSLNATSGKRHDNNLIVYVNMELAMADGIEFFESANGVILTEGINGILPAKYLTYAELFNGVPVYL